MICKYCGLRAITWGDVYKVNLNYECPEAVIHYFVTDVESACDRAWEKLDK